jgi:6-pyruvoyltetrahydropterin/6-carboxytetrahydropterin synthase
LAREDRRGPPKDVQDEIGGTGTYFIELSKARLGFSAAHFLVTHVKCGHIHGHNYKVRIGVQGEKDESGMVIDFGSLTREAIGICREIDGRTMIPGTSSEVAIADGEGEIEIELPDRRYVLPREDVVVLPIEACTAESLAGYFFDRLSPKVEGLAYVEVEESPGSVARYQP